MPAQLNRKRRKPLGWKIIFVGFLALSALVLFIGGIVNIVKGYNLRVWQDTKSLLTLVLTTNPPVIVSYKGATGEIAIIPMPDNLEVVGSYEVGRWKAKSLYELGKQKEIGGRLLSASFQNAFGIPIDGWFDKRGLEWLGFDDVSLVREEKSYPVFLPKNIISSFWPGQDTNLTLFDTTRIALAFSTSPMGSRRVILPERIGVVEEMHLASGEEGWVPAQDIPSRFLTEFSDAGVVEERIGVGIINASGTLRLGKRVARLVESLGAPVVWVKTEGELKERCIVRVSKNSAKTKTQSRLVHFFSCEERLVEELSTPIELMLGEEIAPEYPGQ